MIVYQKSKAEFLDDAFKRNIEDVILAEFTERTGKRVAASEIRSWKESLLSVAKVLNDDDIPSESGVAIEYNIPQTGKRIDFMLAGNSEAHGDCIVILELKQWSSIKKTDKDAIVITQFSGRDVECSHPSYQAWSYASLLENFNEAVYDGGISLFPCAYLHNYDSDGVVTDPVYNDHISRAPVFLKGEAEKKKLQEFIKKYVKFGDKKALIFRLDGGRIRPSKGLVDSLLGMLKGNDEFVLVDDQKVVYENALAIGRRVSRETHNKSKHVLIIEGGPGTGKSVVAINLLVALTKMGLLSKYVTKNAAPRAVFESKLTGSFKKTQISNMFSGSGAFTDSDKDDFGALIVDEAHRLNEKSGLYGNLGEHQIAELIKASRYSIFFIDEDQRVTLKDIGSKAEIIRLAKASGATVRQMELASQFRCNGSDGYLAWLDNSLQIRNTANETLDTDEFDFRVVNSPQTLRELIREKNKANNKARLVAGYCWAWTSKKKPNAMDVVIPEFDFSMQWNLSKDGGLWITAPESINEIGCIHTCQGLEVDYIGVIVGPDLIVRDGRVITRPEKRARQDRSLFGLKKLAKAAPKEAAIRADSIIKNTYRTLMTRGMKGCYVYFTDKETETYFQRLLVLREILRSTEVAANEARPKAVDSGANILPFLRLSAEVAKPYVNSVPLIDLKFAAGTFGGAQSMLVEDVTWVALPERIRPALGLFVAQVVGDSMNRRIPNGAWCLFRMNPVGSRQGKVVVAQHRKIHDVDTGGSYTVKVYESTKKRAVEGEWTHAQIRLKPDSSNSGFSDLVFDAEDDGLSIVAEFIEVLA